MTVNPNAVCIGIVSVKKQQVLLQYQSKGYYIIGQEVYYVNGRFYSIIGHLLHYEAIITLSAGTDPMCGTLNVQNPLNVKTPLNVKMEMEAIVNVIYMHQLSDITSRYNKRD